MKTTVSMKLALVVLLMAVMAAAFAGQADAATVTVSNSLGHKLSLAFYYTDTSGRTVITGWHHVTADHEVTVKLDADTSKPIYYRASNKDIYVDSSTAKGPQVRGPLSYHRFRFAPGDAGDFESRFFKVPADGSVNVDAKWR
jgi:uncharacterized membrane protein